VVHNRWEMVFDEEAPIKEIEAALKTIKAIEVK
jgi:hypothetical protein